MGDDDGEESRGTAGEVVEKAVKHACLIGGEESHIGSTMHVTAGTSLVRE